MASSLGLGTTVDELFARRDRAARAIADDAADLARACHAMAARFRRGGTLLAFGNGAASTDAQRIAVQFAHPVTADHRPLRSMALTTDMATVTAVACTDGFAEVYAHQLRHLGRPEDIAMGVSVDGECVNVRRGLTAAHDIGMLTVALVGAGHGGHGGAIALSPLVDHVVVARSADPRIVKEMHVMAYHIMRELVHAHDVPATAAAR